MNGLLVYSKADYERNKWFAGEILRVAKDKGICMKLVFTDEDIKTKDIDFAIIRTISPDTTRYLESSNIRCFNNYETSILCNNKFTTYETISKLDLPTIPTTLSSKENLYITLTEAFEKYNTDELIVKSVSGHGGKEVFLVHNDVPDIESLLKQCNSLTAHNFFCIQPRIKGIARDLRVYVLGKEIYAARLRTNPSSFKSNFTLGGTCTPYSPGTDLQRLIKIITDNTDTDFIGIDFILDENDKFIFNEIEDVVGTRMLYSTGMDTVVEDYINYIITTVKSHLQANI